MKIKNNNGNQKSCRHSDNEGKKYIGYHNLNAALNERSCL